MPGWVDKSLKVGAYYCWISMRSKIEWPGYLGELCGDVGMVAGH